MKPKAARAPAARAARPYCCPAPTKAAAAALDVVVGVVLALTPEADPDVVGEDVADADADELDAALPLPKVLFVESRVPQVAKISDLHAS